MYRLNKNLTGSVNNFIKYQLRSYHPVREMMKKEQTDGKRNKSKEK